jgi:hypothetical protein
LVQLLFVLWSIGMLISFTYECLVSIVTYSRIGYLNYIIPFVLLASLCKAIHSFKLIKTLRNGYYFSTKQYTAFIVFFIFKVTLVISLIFELFLLVYSMFFLNRFKHKSPFVKFEFSLIPPVICACLYILIFDFPVVTAIRRQYNSSIDTIGQHLHP